MRIINRIMLIVILITGQTQGAEPVKKNFTPEAVVAGFDQRVDAMFRAESGRSPQRQSGGHERTVVCAEQRQLNYPEA